jgi:hypothetical protein
VETTPLFFGRRAAHWHVEWTQLSCSGAGRQTLRRSISAHQRNSVVNSIFFSSDHDEGRNSSRHHLMVSRAKEHHRITDLENGQWAEVPQAAVDAVHAHTVHGSQQFIRSFVTGS